jgi:uncharacterized protein (TIGR02285 family)
MRRLYLLCFLIPAASGVAHATPITVAWREKPPYHYTENGVEKGFLLARGKQIFAAAGIPAQFVEEPTKRIWANFQSRKPNYCSLGRYKLSERGALAQYTAPIHIDPPQAILVAPNAYERARAHRSLATLTADANLSVGLIDGVSYGPQLDALLRNAGAERVLRTVDSNSMMRMVAAGRVSYTFADRYGWEYLRERDSTLVAVTEVEFADNPPGMTRHLMCSKDIPASTMRKLNRVIEAMKISERTPREQP